MIRMGVLGGGFGGAFYWDEHPGCVVQAVAEANSERRAGLAKRYACDTSYESLDEMLRDPLVDAVAVFSGAPDHVRHCIACMNAGKHVFCAVPACMTLDEAQLLKDAVKSTGMTYMMAETSWYHQTVIAARNWHREGKFGTIFHTEAEYHHPGLDVLYYEADGSRSWRYGLPPMHYPTHSTAYLVGVTGECLTHVSCIGWGDDSPVLKDNDYNNPFWNQTAFFTTDGGHSFRVGVYWNAAVGGTERGEWYGDKMSFFDATPNGAPAIIRRAANQTELDDGGFARSLPERELYERPEWWKTEMLPEPLRHDSGHDGSHTFLTHEFIEALSLGRAPAIGIREALNMTVPGIVAHQSSLRGGERLAIPGF